MPIKPLTPAVRKTADYHIANPGDSYCLGVWLPDDKKQGVVQVDSWAKPNDGVNHYMYQIASGAAAYQKSPLKSTMHFLGMQGDYGKLEGSNMRSTRYSFPEVGQLAAKTAILNESLPAEHQLPDFEPYPGGGYPDRTFLEALARGKVLVSTGRNKDGQIDHAYSAAHNMAFNVPYWLSATPRMRDILSRKAQEAIDATTVSPTGNYGYDANLPTGRAMHDISIGISAMGMRDIVIEDECPRRIHHSFSEALDASHQGTQAYALEAREHIQFLDHHISQMS